MHHTQKARLEMINFIKSLILSAHGEGKRISKEKLIASLSIGKGVSERKANEYIASLVKTEWCQETNGEIGFLD